jgi:hypothetical protein
MLQIGAAVIAVAVVVRPAVPDDKDDSKSRDAEERREAARLIQADLPRWKLTMGEGAAELKLNPNPILRWTNPAVGRMNGEIFLWTADGRPEAVMSLYKVWEPDWGFTGELHSLSLKNIVAERDKTVVWKCDKPGITLRDVPDAPAVAQTAPKRLQQMRAMAQDFSVMLIDSRNNSKGDVQSLRFLTQPVHRYASPRSDVVDGALYAFVVGTDVEAFLLLEARGATGAPRWQYALARLNRDELAVSFREKEVWRVGQARYEDREGPYVFMGLPQPTK